MRQVLGGGMRQSGLMAAACLVGLDQMNENLKTDNENAQQLAKFIESAGSGIVEVSKTETNIVKLTVIPENMTSQMIVERLKTVRKFKLSLKVSMNRLDQT